MDTQQQTSLKILLIGDSCLDYYHFGTCERLSPEAPVPVLKQDKVVLKEGMSLNVKNNLESFGIKVHHITNEKIIEKHRIVDRKSNYQITRYDVNENSALPEINLTGVKASDYDCLVISDYCKGTISRQVAKEACDMFKDKPIFVDSKKKDLSCFSNCYVKINRKERGLVTVHPVNSKYIITLGSDGAIYQGKTFRTEKVEVFDVCGAGDVFISSLSYAFLINNNIEKSIVYANKLATRSVTKFGTYVLSEGDINDFCI